MPKTKSTESDTLTTDSTHYEVYAVILDDGEIVSVRARTAEEAIKKAKAKE